MLFVILVLSFLTSANEVTTGEDDYIEEQEEYVKYVPGPRSTRIVRRRCREGECRRPLPPIVEGQKLVYISTPQQSNYVQLHEPVKLFFKQWAKSCYEKETLESWFNNFTVRNNNVTSFAGSLEMLEQPKFQMGWQKLLAEYDPKILIFLLKTPEKPYTTERWKKLLAQIPTYLGCVLMAPPTQSNVTGSSKHFKNLREAIASQNSSCQLVRADEQILSLAQADRAKIFTLQGQMTASGQSEWWKQTRFQLCEMEPMRDVSGSPGRAVSTLPKK